MSLLLDTRCKEIPNRASELVKSPYFWNLISVISGIILGFLLGEGSRYLRYRLRIRKLKRVVKEELMSILAQIPWKKTIIGEIIDNLDEEKVLSGLSVGIMNTGYKQHIAELYEHLSILQRNCLHVIHERLNIADKTLSSFEHDIASAVREKIIDKPFELYKSRLQEILQSYNVIEDLIKKYLAGKPIDVFW
ncbi:hypothetical protein ES703_45947 [subsurface metagenome]